MACKRKINKNKGKRGKNKKPNSYASNTYIWKKISFNPSEYTISSEFTSNHADFAQNLENKNILEKLPLKNITNVSAFITNNNRVGLTYKFNSPCKNTSLMTEYVYYKQSQKTCCPTWSIGSYYSTLAATAFPYRIHCCISKNQWTSSQISFSTMYHAYGLRQIWFSY